MNIYNPERLAPRFNTDRFIGTVAANLFGLRLLRILLYGTRALIDLSTHINTGRNTRCCGPRAS
jgi:hypothetical protein